MTTMMMATSLYDLEDVLLNGDILQEPLVADTAYLKGGAGPKCGITGAFPLFEKNSVIESVPELNLDLLIDIDDLNDSVKSELDYSAASPDDLCYQSPTVADTSPQSCESSELIDSDVSFTAFDFLLNDIAQPCCDDLLFGLASPSPETEDATETSGESEQTQLTAVNDELVCLDVMPPQDNFSIAVDVTPDLVSVIEAAQVKDGGSSHSKCAMTTDRISGFASRKKSKVSSVEERKQRKRDQNKNAATRYRERKRQELKEKESEKSDLDTKNKTLKDKVNQIAREIDYLKELMIEVYRIKGYIS